MIGASLGPDLLFSVAGPVLDEADRYIARGLLRATATILPFATSWREAILAVMAPHRRRLLHARVLVALRKAPEAERDLARLAHRRGGRGSEAVLECSIAAAEQAAALHAYHEAAAQYAVPCASPTTFPGLSAPASIRGARSPAT